MGISSRCRDKCGTLFSLRWPRSNVPRSNSNTTPEYTYTDTSASRDYIVIHPYFERRPDELCLRQGGLVSIRSVHDDGWAYGACSTSGKRGMFPLVCVCPARVTSDSVEKPALLMFGAQRPSVGIIIPRRITSIAVTCAMLSSMGSTNSIPEEQLLERGHFDPGIPRFPPSPAVAR